MENFRIGAGSLLAILLIAPLALSIPKGVRAARSYDVELKSILRDGIMTDAEMESFIDRLGNEKKRPLEDVRDFPSCVRCGMSWRARANPRVN